MSHPVLAWHFVSDDRTLRDGRPLPAVGETLRYVGRLSMCVSGLHASRRAIDALQYAPGAFVCRVECGGGCIEGSDKLVCRERTIVACADATRTLCEFAVWCARDALEKERAAGREPDERSWRAIAAKEAWSRGEATDVELAAAATTAWAAATTARAAAKSAAAAGVMFAPATAAAAARSAAAAAAGFASDGYDAVARARFAAQEVGAFAFRSAQNAELERRLRGLLGLLEPR